MAEKIVVSEVVRNFADYINRVAYRGESFTLIRGNKPVAELAPVVSGRRLGDLPHLLASLPSLSASDSEAFATDIDHSRAGISTEPIRDPWES